MLSRRKFNLGLASGIAAIAAPLQALAGASNIESPHTPTSKFRGEWTKHPLAQYPKAVGASSKHTRWAWRSLTGDWYLNGGDYTQHGEKPSVLESGSNNTWRVDFRKNSWERVSGYWPKEGEIIPSHPDETIWVYDSKRDIFWLGGGYQWPAYSPADRPEAAPVPIAVQNRMLRGHWMSFDPNTKKWKDHGLYGGPGASKHGIYDAQTDTVYAPYYDGGWGNALTIYHCATGTWGPRTAMGGPNIGDIREDYFAFDSRRRRMLFLSKIDFSAHCYDIGARKWFELPTRKPRPHRGYGSYGLTYHAGLDVYVMHGGGSINPPQATNDLWILPSEGGEWQEVTMRGSLPSPRVSQVLMYDPGMDALISFGGKDGVDDHAYFVARISA